MISMWGIGLPLAYLFGIHLGFGLAGIWISFIADEWVRGILMYRRWRSRIWIQKVWRNTRLNQGRVFLDIRQNLLHFGLCESEVILKYIVLLRPDFSKTARCK